MKTFSLFALVVVLGIGTASLLRTDQNNRVSSPSETAAQASDGAFRDGLYLGTLAAQRGAESHIAVGRWAASQDRSSFTAGYQQGYSDFLASRVVDRSRASD